MSRKKFDLCYEEQGMIDFNLDFYPFLLYSLRRSTMLRLQIGKDVYYEKNQNLSTLFHLICPPFVVLSCC